MELSLLVGRPISRRRPCETGNPLDSSTLVSGRPALATNYIPCCFPETAVVGCDDRYRSMISYLRGLVREWAMSGHDCRFRRKMVERHTPQSNFLFFFEL